MDGTRIARALSNRTQHTEQHETMPLTSPVIVEDVTFTREKTTTQLLSEMYKEEREHPQEDFDYYEQRENEHYTNHHRLVKELKEEGIVPTLPILLIPGFASSSLKVEQGYKKWENKRIWISLHKLGISKIKHTIGKGHHHFYVSDPVSFP